LVHRPRSSKVTDPLLHFNGVYESPRGKRVTRSRPASPFRTRQEWFGDCTISSGDISHEGDSYDLQS
jgi:hypothetical protein